MWHTKGAEYTMMLLQAFFLAILQGVTEFLPISSSAHLILVREFAEWQEQGLAFDVSLHLGSLGALLVYFRRDLYSLALGASKSLRHRKLHAHGRVLFMLFLATLPIVCVGSAVVALSTAGTLRSPHVIAWANLVLAPFLLIADRRRGTRKIESITVRHAFLIGCWQSLSVIPGASRSGVTMTGALFLGYTRQEATRIAMLLAVPSIIGAGLLSGVSAFEAGSLPPIYLLITGVLISFITAYASIALLLKVVEQIGMLPFVVYRIALGVMLLLVLHAT